MIGGMGVRRWFLDLLSRGEEPVGDPAEMVDLEMVPLAVGPMTIARLEDAGIAATGIESFNIATNVRSHMRIMVRRDQFTAAAELLRSSE